MAKILGITADSREVKPGMIFVAIKGVSSDGHDYIDEALKKGAVRVFGEKDINNPKYVKVPDSRAKLGELASEFYGYPSKKLKVIGVTGTKGKTTTVHLIHHLLRQFGKKAGLISSISDTGLHVTSPDVVSLHKFMKGMVDAGQEYAVIEVSSHGIDQKRIAGVNFEVGVLTNIAPEHLDYHKSLTEYKKVKMSFINSCKFKVIAPKETEINILPGKFNNLNAEVAVWAVGKLGFDRKKALSFLNSFALPEGRLQEVKNNKGFKIVVDFAHTPDSLEAVLKHLKSEKKGRLISVFGCAGERDPRKRTAMGKISVGLSDLSIFTAEDPRSEDVYDILGSMAKGARDAGGVENDNFMRIPERGEAVAYALSIAKKGDTVGFFGKGHETSMAYQGFEHPWNEIAEVENFLSRDTNISAIILAAGKGTRMKSVLPKALHNICGRPMIAYSLQNLRRAKIGEIITVVSYRKNLVINEIGAASKVAVQKNPKGGTADAVATGLKKVSQNIKTVLVMYGDDTAFYSPETINKVIETHRSIGSKLTFITLTKADPKGLGRIIRDENNNLIDIIEEKDATPEQRKINEVNDGMYIFEKELLAKNLPKAKKSPITGELYINEVIKMIIDQKEKTSTYRLPDVDEWQGVNTQEELARAEQKMKEKLL